MGRQGFCATDINLRALSLHHSQWLKIIKLIAFNFLIIEQIYMRLGSDKACKLDIYDTLSGRKKKTDLRSLGPQYYVDQSTAIEPAK